MATPKNLTSAITHLRDRSGGFHVGKEAEGALVQKSSGERPLAPDFFQLFACILLGVTAVAQFVLLVWMDLL
jgi:hypothetical protein